MHETVSDISINLAKDELWLLHNSIPLQAEIDGIPVGYNILSKVWDGILNCEDDDMKQANIIFDKGELVCIAGTIPSNHERAKSLLLKCMRGLWQINNGVRLREEPENLKAMTRLLNWQRDQLSPDESIDLPKPKKRSKKGIGAEQSQATNHPKRSVGRPRKS